jgi:hypothetical protein
VRRPSASVGAVSAVEVSRWTLSYVSTSAPVIDCVPARGYAATATHRHTLMGSNGGRPPLPYQPRRLPVLPEGLLRIRANLEGTYRRQGFLRVTKRLIHQNKSPVSVQSIIGAIDTFLDIDL